MNRRDALRLLAAVGASAAGVSVISSTSPERPRGSSPGPLTPSLFVAHGAPPLLDDPAWMGELQRWAAGLARPKAVLVISAHWDESPASLGATSTVPLVYDFYGFPKRYYEMTYPSPGAPALAERVRELFREAKLPFREEPSRGLDHGAYVPLMAMYPKADVPVLQLSLPGLSPKALLQMGQVLAPLRKEGVLIIGSGFLTHNMRAFSETTPAWASEFDAWVKGALERRDTDALVDFMAKGPAARTALPTVEHYVPLLVAAGAAEGASVKFPIEGFWFGSFTRRSVQFG